MTAPPQRTAVSPLEIVALAYLGLPLLIWAFSWWHRPVPLLILSGLATGGGLYWGGLRLGLPPLGIRRPRVDFHKVLAIAALALTATMLTAAGNLLDGGNSGDWVRSPLMFHALATEPWPVVLPVGGEARLLAYYLGWYMVPGLVGKVSVYLVGWAVLAWTWLGIGLLLALFTARNDSRWAVLAGGLFFLLFNAGMDLVQEGKAEGSWLDWLAQLPYTSVMSSLQYLPQHFLGAGLVALLTCHSRSPAAVGPLAVAAASFWSPFGALGGMAIWLARVVGDGWDGWRESNGLSLSCQWGIIPAGLAAFAPALLVACYLLAGPDFPFRLSGSGPESTNYIAAWPVKAVLLDFGLLAALVAALSPEARRSVVFWTAVALLVALLFTDSGLYNELMNRTGMVGYVVLAWFCWRALGMLWEQCRGGTLARRQRVLGVALLLVLALGAYTPYAAVWRAVHHPAQVMYQHIPRGELVRLDSYLPPTPTGDTLTGDYYLVPVDRFRGIR